MLPAELTFLTANILALPCVGELHSAGLVLLRDAFVKADFTIGKDIPAEIKGLTFYLGGFEVVDPATDAVLRVMSEVRHSTTRVPEAGGLAYNWVAAAELGLMRTLPADRRELHFCEVRAQRIIPRDLAAMDADAVLALFEGVLSSDWFRGTEKQASEFVAALIYALTP